MEKNTGENLWFGVRQIFFRIEKFMNGKRKNWSIEPDQIKNTGFSKDTDKKMKRQATAWEKYLQNTHVIKNCAGHQHFCSQVQIFWTSQVLCRLYDDGGGLWKYFTWDTWLDVMPVEEAGRTRRRKGFFLPVSQSPEGSRVSCPGLLQTVFLCCLASAEGIFPQKLLKVLCHR